MTGFSEIEGDLFIRKGQQGTLRKGITRAQAARYFRRRAATQRAAQIVCSNGVTLKDEIDSIIAAGHDKISWEGIRWLYLGEDEDRFRFGTKVEHDYIRVALNLGDFARNY